MATSLMKYIENYDHIIWDFNGTLVDDTSLCAKLVCRQLTNDNLPSITTEEYRELFCFPVIKYYEKLGYDFNETCFKKLAKDFIEEYREKVPTIQLFNGTKEILQNVLDMGMQQSILSAASQDDLQSMTNFLEITNFFDHIYGLPDHYAASKLERGRELINHSQINTQKTLLIGDTDHDLEVGKALMVDVLLIADGHQTYERLTRVHDNVLQSRYDFN